MNLKDFISHDKNQQFLYNILKLVKDEEENKIEEFLKPYKEFNFETLPKSGISTTLKNLSANQKLVLYLMQKYNEKYNVAKPQDLDELLEKYTYISVYYYYVYNEINNHLKTEFKKQFSNNICNTDQLDKLCIKRIYQDAKIFFKNIHPFNLEDITDDVYKNIEQSDICDKLINEANGMIDQFNKDNAKNIKKLNNKKLRLVLNLIKNITLSMLLIASISSLALFPTMAVFISVASAILLSYTIIDSIDLYAQFKEYKSDAKDVIRDEVKHCYRTKETLLKNNKQDNILEFQSFLSCYKFKAFKITPPSSQNMKIVEILNNKKEIGTCKWN